MEIAPLELFADMAGVGRGKLNRGVRQQFDEFKWELSQRAVDSGLKALPVAGPVAAYMGKDGIRKGDCRQNLTRPPKLRGASETKFDTVEGLDPPWDQASFRGWHSPESLTAPQVWKSQCGRPHFSRWPLTTADLYACALAPAFCRSQLPIDGGAS